MGSESLIMNRSVKSIIFSALAVITSIPVLADVRVPEIFSDHAVLQRSKQTAIFGTADPGEKVTVSFQGKSASAVADKNGRFLVSLDLSSVGNNAGELVIAGKNRLVFKDIIVGEVWLCAGQSNMAMKVSHSLNGSAAEKSSANNRIRLFQPTLTLATAPLHQIRGKWLIASPENTGRFSAVGYYFARKLNKECGFSVGLINPSWGGTKIEAWICAEHTASAPSPAQESAKTDLYNFNNYRTLRDEYVKKLKAWENSLGWIDENQSSVPPADAKWEKAPSLTSKFNGAGVVWFRKTIDVLPTDLKNGMLQIWIGRVAVETKIYWDGKLVLTLTRSRALENWPVRFNIRTTPGKHTMLMRVSATEKNFSFPRENLIGVRANASGWEFCREKDFPAPAPEKLAARPKFLPNRPYQTQVPNQLWNSLISPITPYTIKGALWYQGESNAGVNGRLYGKQIETLIKCLREDFKNPQMRFYAVQLPDHQVKVSDPNISGYWPEIRDLQSRVIRKTPFAAEVITIGCGESADIHPMDKLTVGERLADVALKNDYGKKDIIASYPIAQKAILEKGGKVRITFTGCPDGLAAGEIPATYWVIRSRKLTNKLLRNSPASQLEGFAVCGKNGKWFWANAEIDGSSVIVHSPSVPYPVRVRYAWQNNPTCNLFNKAGLPAAPFTLNTAGK